MITTQPAQWDSVVAVIVLGSALTFGHLAGRRPARDVGTVAAAGAYG